MIRYKSNKRPIGDGVRITRVSGGGQRLEVMTDPLAETYSEIELVADAPAPDPVPDPTPQPDPDPSPAPSPTPVPVPVPAPQPAAGSVRALAGWKPDRDDGTDCDILIEPGGPVPSWAAAEPLVRARLSAGQDALVRARAGIYRETITMRGMGAAGGRVTLAGYGTEKPEFTGFEPMTGWRPCDAGDALVPAAIRGEVWRTTLPTSALPPGGLAALFLREADSGVCIPAILRGPNPSQPNRTAATGDWLVSTGPVVSGGKIVGHAHPSLIGADPAAVIASEVLFHANPNVNVRSGIKSFDPATGTVMFTNTGADYETNANRDRFALVNYLPAIQPGQYASAASGGTLTIWFRPRRPGVPQAEYSARGKVVDMAGASHVTLRGLALTGASSAGGSTDGNYAIGIETTGDESAITVENCLIAQTYRAGRDYASIWMRTVDHAVIRECTISDSVNQFGVFVQGTDPSDPCLYPLIDRVLFENMDNSPVRIYGCKAPAVVRCATVNCGHTAHANIISFYEGTSDPLVLACDFRGAAGYITPQEAGGFSVALSLVTTNEGQAGGRAIVDQDRRDPGGKFTPSGHGYVLSCDLAPSPTVLHMSNALSLGVASRPENSYEVRACAIHGADPIARDANKRARVTAWSHNVLTAGQSLDPSDVHLSLHEVWTDAASGDLRRPSTSPLHVLPRPDLTAQIADLIARHPQVPADAWGADLNGDPVDWSRAPIGAGVLA